MPIKLTAPIEQEFELVDIDRKYGNTGEPTVVKIRQATQAQHEERMQLYSRLEQESRANQDGVKTILELNIERIKRKEVYLTLCGCNILDESGAPLFRFKKDRSGRDVLAMSEHEFNEAWGKLPPDIADAIHECVLKVNIDWNPLGEEL